MPPLEFGNAYVPVVILSCSRVADAGGQVTWVQRFQAHLSSKLQLRQFPFDKQRLTILILSYAPDGPVIKFEHDREIDGIASEGYAGLAEWRLGGLTMTSGSVPLFTRATERVSKAEFVLLVSRRVLRVEGPAAYSFDGDSGVRCVLDRRRAIRWQAKIVFTMMLSLVTFSFAIAGFLPRVDYLTFFGAVFLTSFVFAFAS